MNNDIIEVRTIKDRSGELSFFEANKNIPFEIKRVYYITNVEKGQTRGFHAHKKLKQLMICINGQIDIMLDDGKNKKSFLLSSPEKGLLVDSCIWRTMKFIDDNSILLVAASEYYDENDYIRNYVDFITYMDEIAEDRERE